MRGKITLISLASVSALAAIALAPSAGAENVTQSATGSGQFEFTSDVGVTALRTFAFAAIRTSDGRVTGQAQIYNRAVPGRLHIQVDCLNVIGNIAVLSGTYTYSTDPAAAPGDKAIFAVQDNGEGAGTSPDRVTRAFANTGLVCTDITAANVGLYTYLLNDVQAGNIDIH
jgi:hypothetical protein